MRIYFPADENKTWVGLGNFRCGGCNHCDSAVKKKKKKTYVFSCKVSPGKSLINFICAYVIYKLNNENVGIFIGQTKRKLRLEVAKHK